VYDGWLQSDKSLTFVHKIIRKIVIKKCEAWVGTSRHSMEMLKYYGAKQDGLFRSHLCIDNSKFMNVDFEKREFDIIFSGQIIERKMPFFFCDVAELIKNKRGKCKALIIGNGNLIEKMKESLDEKGVESVFAGFVQQENLPKYYSNAKVFLFPTIEDPWGIVANEACASGTPVITCSYAGAANDLIKSEVNGFVLSLKTETWAEHAIMLIENKELWKKHSQNAVNYVKEYNFEAAANGIIKAIEYSISH
jgi:glycosyltransferase involved in cell wall biosynthesis